MTADQPQQQPQLPERDWAEAARRLRHAATRYPGFDALLAGAEACEQVARAIPLAALLHSAVTSDGAHHKQWFLEQVAALLGIDLPDHDAGVAP